MNGTLKRVLLGAVVLAVVLMVSSEASAFHPRAYRGYAYYPSTAYYGYYSPGYYDPGYYSYSWPGVGYYRGPAVVLPRTYYYGPTYYAPRVYRYGYYW